MESLADAYSTACDSSYVCAVCKCGNAHRLKSKLICENTGCLELNLVTE